MINSEIQSKGCYLSPEIFVVEICPEGVLCASGDEQMETLGENAGSW